MLKLIGLVMRAIRTRFSHIKRNWLGSAPKIRMHRHPGHSQAEPQKQADKKPRPIHATQYITNQQTQIQPPLPLSRLTSSLSPFTFHHPHGLTRIDSI